MTTKRPNGEKKSKCDKKIDNFEKELKKLKNEVEKLKQELKEKDNKLLRSYANLQNYQKRTQKELQCKEDETKRKYISELIELNELLKTAYEDKDPKNGLKLMLNNLEKFFEKCQFLL